MSTVKLRVNGAKHTLEVDPRTPLLYILRNDLELNGPKFGCGLGQCGSCTVLINGSAVRSCVTLMSSVGDSEITTLEGIGTPENPHPVQQAWIETQAVQCGYCMNGQLMASKALLDRNPRPTDAQIRDALAKVLCRCGTYYRVLQAVKRASQIIRASNVSEEEVASL